MQHLIPLFLSLVLYLWSGPSLLLAQSQADSRIGELQNLLDSMSYAIPGLLDSSDVSFSDVPLHDVIRVIGKTHGINLYIENSINQSVSNTFVREPVQNILLFLCKKFSLSIEPTGTILHITAFLPPKPIREAPPAKVLKIEYVNNLLTFDLNKDTLSAVIRQVSQLTGKTLVPAAGVPELLSGYIPPSEANEALRNLFLMNASFVEESGNTLFIKPLSFVQANRTPQPPGRAGRNTANSTSEITLRSLPTGLSLQAQDVPLDELVRKLFGESGFNYFIYGNLEGNATVHITDSDLPTILQYLFEGTAYTYRIDNEVYMVGERNREGFVSSAIVKLKYRPSDEVIDLIPASLKEGLSLQEYVELNRIILSGDPAKIETASLFIQEIDRPVPMVKIEMLVIDVNTSRTLQAGLRAGLLRPGDSISGGKSILPGLDYTLSGGNINDIISTANIPFLNNIGTLNSNFYLQVSAQESRGNIKVVTRPVISTLNGIEASLTIGETQYFKLLTNTTTAAAVNPITQVTEAFREIAYNTSLFVTPYISDDDMVTLQLTPNFTTPGTQTDPSIPPSLQTREFSSTIRVRNGETVVLGGLDRNTNSTSTEGLPFLSRIPVLKWFFGNNVKSKTKSSLLIYITPTIYYN